MKNPRKAKVAAEKPNPPELKQDQPKEPKIDHLAYIRDLANDIQNASPAGAKTIAAQIIEHLDAHSK